MTRKERVIAALNHQDTDFVPYHVDITGQAMERLKAHTGYAQLLKTSGLHLDYVQYWGWPTELPDKEEHFLDEFGVI